MAAKGKLAAGFGMAAAAAFGVKELAVAPKVMEALAPSLRETTSVYSAAARDLPGIGSLPGDIGKGTGSSGPSGHYYQKFDGSMEMPYTTNYGTAGNLKNNT